MSYRTMRVRHSRQGFEAMDFVVLAFLAGFIVVISALRFRLPDPSSALIVWATTFVAYLAMVRLLAHLRAVPALSLLFRAAALYFVTYAVYSRFDLVVEFLNPFRAEQTLMAIDRFIFFGHSPNVMLESWLTPIGVDIFEVVYACYYPLFLLPALMLVRGNRQRFAAYLTSVSFVFFGAFIGYMLVPARSPYVLARIPELAASTGLSTDVAGGPIGTFIRHFIDNFEGFKFDCFPSGHTAGAVLVFMTLFSWKKIAGLLVAPLCLALVFSTVYLQYHYVIDLIGGTVLAIVVFLLGRILVQRLPYGGENEV